MASTQDLDCLDYLAPLILVIIFILIIFIISFTCINFFCIGNNDDLTVFDDFGAKYHLRLGPHSLKKIEEIKRRQRLMLYEEGKINENAIDNTDSLKISTPIKQVSQMDRKKEEN
uniref:Uncharacterized protein n=1 Tax=Parastrongyloides trichosuri TaxID=131310 RepID=A0A0N4ZIT8_PARTI